MDFIGSLASWIVQIFSIGFGFLFSVGSPYGFPVMAVIVLTLIFGWLWRILSDSGKGGGKSE